MALAPNQAFANQLLSHSVIRGVSAKAINWCNCTNMEPRRRSALRRGCVDA
jgi:hypothetical protein